MVRRGLASERRSGAGVELVLYVTFWTVTIAGIASWLLVGGSAPLLGPVPLGPLPHTRHQVVDIHHIAGLVALPLAVHHVGHRWGLMVRGLRLWARRIMAGRNRAARDPIRPLLPMAPGDKEV